MELFVVRRYDGEAVEALQAGGPAGILRPLKCVWGGRGGGHEETFTTAQAHTINKAAAGRAALLVCSRALARPPDTTIKL